MSGQTFRARLATERLCDKQHVGRKCLIVYPGLEVFVSFMLFLVFATYKSYWRFHRFTEIAEFVSDPGNKPDQGKWVSIIYFVRTRGGTITLPQYHSKRI